MDNKTKAEQLDKIFGSIATMSSFLSDTQFSLMCLELCGIFDKWNPGSENIKASRQSNKETEC